jgi:hypothetical protein
MRRLVAWGRYSVYSDSCCRPCSRPATKLVHTAGLAPNSHSSKKAWRRKLRMSAKYSSLPSPGSDQL